MIDKMPHWYRVIAILLFAINIVALGFVALSGILACARIFISGILILVVVLTVGTFDLAYAVMLLVIYFRYK